MNLFAYNSEISTALLTLAGGIILYILSRIFEIKFFQSIYKYNQLKGRVKFLLVLHANEFGNKKAWEHFSEEFFKGLEDTRKAASELCTFAYTHNLVRRLGLVPSKKRLLEAASKLIALSNCAKGHYDFIEARKKSIETKLKL